MYKEPEKIDSNGSDNPTDQTELCGTRYRFGAIPNLNRQR